jgi:hypothetical protein
MTESKIEFFVNKKKVKFISTQSGDVEVTGNVDGSISTMSNDVDCENVNSLVSTMSGNIKHKK